MKMEKKKKGEVKRRYWTDKGGERRKERYREEDGR